LVPNRTLPPGNVYKQVACGRYVKWNGHEDDAYRGFESPQTGPVHRAGHETEFLDIWRISSLYIAYLQPIPEIVVPENIVSTEQTEHVNINVLLRAATDTHFKHSI